MPIQTNSNSKISVSDLQVDVSLGCTEAERQIPQSIAIDFSLSFTAMLAGMKTDMLENTFCYAKAITQIQSLIHQHQPFYLVESIVGLVYASLYHDLLSKGFDQVLIEVNVTKLKPVIKDFSGQFTVSYSGYLEKGTQDDLYQHWF